jgi:hypothetical protein
MAMVSAPHVATAAIAALTNATGMEVVSIAPFMFVSFEPLFIASFLSFRLWWWCVVVVSVVVVVLPRDTTTQRL